MNEADILALTYEDSCMITRKGGMVKDPVTKQSQQTETLVGEDIPCALSSASGGGIRFSEGHGSYQSGYILFCRPGVDIQAGDKVTVQTKPGHVYTLWAGRPLTYGGSHTQTPLSEEERT